MAQNLKVDGSDNEKSHLPEMSLNLSQNLYHCLWLEIEFSYTKFCWGRKHRSLLSSPMIDIDLNHFSMPFTKQSSYMYA